MSDMFSTTLRGSQRVVDQCSRSRSSAPSPLRQQRCPTAASFKLRGQHVARSSVADQHALAGITPVSRPSSFIPRTGHSPLPQRWVGTHATTASFLGPITTPPSQTDVQLLQLNRPTDRALEHLLVYLPGTDGTGQAICTQVPGLHAAGFDVWAVRIPPDNRQGWTALVGDCATLLRQLTRGSADVFGPPAGAVPGAQRPLRKVTLVGESFGGCLGLRLALEVPELIECLVLVNPATCYSSSLNGMTSLVTSTGLLRFFPEALYTTAQETLLPLLVDTERVGPESTELLKRMIFMEPPAGVMQLSGGTEGRGGLFSPAGAANYRAEMLREGGLPDELLRSIDTPTLLISSARDRMFPSILEGARLQRVLRNASRVILPDSAHAALLERDVSLARILEQSGFSPARGAPESNGNGTSSSSRQGAAHDSSEASGSNGASSSTPAPAAAQHQAVAATHTSAAAAAASAVGAGLPGLPTFPASASSASPESPTGSAGQGSAGGTAGGTASGAARAGKQGSRTDQARRAGIDPFAQWSQRLAPWRDLVSPVVLGTERLPPPGSADFARPMLFVGNHQKMGLYDTPLLVQELYLRGYSVRGLAHPGHWASPVGAFFEEFGAVKASPMAAYRLLKAGEKVLLFPGGAREVVKRRGEEYTLIWKESPDFVRLAAKCQALIVPFAAVGADDAYDVIMETDDLLANPVLGPITRALLSRADGDLTASESIFPITRMPILGFPTPVPIPNLQRLYFKFGTPLDTRELAANLKDGEEAEKLYARVRADIEKMLGELLVVRSQDEDSQVGPRLGRAITRFLPFLAGLNKAM